MSQSRSQNQGQSQGQERREGGRIALLPGDGVGPEVTRAARRVLEAVADAARIELEFEEGLIGGGAIDATLEAAEGPSPLPEESLAICRRADAILLGAVGGPRWSDPSAAVRPEQGLLALRRHFELFANLRPVAPLPQLVKQAPLRPELMQGVDLLIVRELTGGLYFGRRKEEGETGGGLPGAYGRAETAWDTLIYSEAEVERVAHVAFQAAGARQGRLASIDKANVLASMRLWRRTVDRVAEHYPEVEVEHVLVDAAAMRLLRAPASFDVVLAGNLFGDILSDEASVLAGSLGMLPSASLGEGTFGLYEPVHGSAPDIAGRGIANPVAAVLSAALLLRHSLGLAREAEAIEKAVASTFEQGLRTADLLFGADADPSLRRVGSEEMTDAILEALPRT